MFQRINGAAFMKVLWIKNGALFLFRGEILTIFAHEGQIEGFHLFLQLF
jgi:hypothetical protein